MKTSPGFTGCLAALCLISLAVQAQESDTMVPDMMSQTIMSTTDETAGIEFFESRIRPVLVRECYACHSAQAGQAKGGLQLDSKTSLLLGGDSGPVLVPGSPDDSPLWSAINHEDYVMPPGKQLSSSELEDFRTWIEMGAPDPRVPETARAAATVTDADIRRGRQFWSFVPPQKPPLPDHGPTWALNEIDQFVFEQLRQNDLRPAADAGPETVLRRLCLDLAGLPPTPDQRIEFLNQWQSSPDSAVQVLVDRLLDSPEFGERWGRHWLDVARYAESSGKEVNATYSQAWRYRDYVIDSFNADKPYDRFVQEQIAGDLLPVDSDQEWAENLIATGFLALGPKTLIEQNPRQFVADLIDEQIDATSRVVLGVSVACARCHDHKFDPIPQSDYYAMAGIFRSTRTFYGTLDTRQNRRPAKLIRLPVPDPRPVARPLDRQQVQQLQQRVAELDEEIRELTRLRREARQSGETPPDIQATIRQLASLGTRRSALQQRLDEVDESGQPRALCMGVQPAPRPVNANFLVRGEVDQPGELVPRGFVQVLDEDPASIPDDSGGRLELAYWLTARDNPLTARVMVNRIWQHLLGQAIVTSTDNFGATGQAPSHPELLDWLAVTFMDDGWSVKQMVRRIATSRTYRMASTWDAAAFQQDPENRLLWRANPTRLDAEVLRDSMLAVCGKLDRQRPLASDVARAGETVSRDGSLRMASDLVLRQMENAENRASRPRPGQRNNRRTGNPRSEQDRFLGVVDDTPQADPVAFYRSVYLPILRDHVPRALEVFDFAESSMIVGTRESSNTPDQGLYFLNNRLVIFCSDALARRLAGEASSVNDQIERAFELCYGRSPGQREMAAARKFYNNFEVAGRDPQHKKLAAVCQSIMASAEFRIVD